MLFLEPYLCFSHQRMLDGLDAGTLVVARDHPVPHPGNLGPQQLAATLTALSPGGDDWPADNAAALARVPAGAERDAMAALLDRHRAITWDRASDAVAQLNSLRRAGVLPDATGALPPLPDLGDVLFRDAAEMNALCDRLLADPGERRALRDRQYAAVNARLTFRAMLERTLPKIRAAVAR